VTRTRSWTALALLFLAILVIARMTLYSFPLASEDDARFFLPAWSLAVHGTLNVPTLNAPSGIFWVPDGLYVYLAFFLRVFGPTIAVAHWVMQVTTATAMVILVIAFRRICGDVAYLLGLLLISPGVIFAANTIRMEPLLLLLFAVGLLLHTYDRVAAASVFLLGGCVHPALVLGACLYAVTLRKRPSRMGVLVAVGVLCAIGLEAVHVYAHLSIFHQHMAFQVARKATRSDRSLRLLLLSKRGIMLGLECLFVGVAAWERKPLPVALVALGLSFYAVMGREIPYNVYSYAVVPATFFCLASTWFAPQTGRATSKGDRLPSPRPLGRTPLAGMSLQ
jgi:hypothetical protein